MGTFVDTTGNGKAYLIRSVQNQYAGISQVQSFDLIVVYDISKLICR